MDEQTLEDLIEPTRENSNALRQRIRELRQYREIRSKLTSEQLAIDLDGAVSEVQADNFMAGKTGILPPSGHEALVRHLWDNKWWSDTWIQEGIAGHPVALFYALCSFLGTGEETKNNLRKEIIGTYRIWRSSMHFPGQYLLGKLIIENDYPTKAVRVTELHIFKGDDLASAQREVFEGFLVKKSRYFILIARQSGRHKGAPRVTMIHNALYDNGIVQALQGVVTGCYGSNKMFATPVYIERVDGEAASRLEDELDVRHDIPASIKAKLQVRLEENVIRF